MSKFYVSVCIAPISCMGLFQMLQPKLLKRVVESWTMARIYTHHEQACNKKVAGIFENGKI